MTTYEVKAERDGNYWFVTVPAIGRATQARHVREIDMMARDLIESMTGEPPESFDLTVTIELPDTVTEALQAAKDLRAQAAALQTDAATCHRQAVRELKTAGLALRDIGALLGISHQRVFQLNQEATTADQLTA